MRNNSIKACLLLLGLIAGCRAANAAIDIFAFQTGPNLVNGFEATQSVHADLFNIGANGTMTNAFIFIGGLGGIGNWDGTVQYYFFTSIDKPGALLATGTGKNVTVTDTGLTWAFGGNVFRLDFEFESPFFATEETNYWFGIHLSTNFDVDGIYWMGGDTGRNSFGSLQGTFDNWVLTPTGAAYALIGVVTEVREPNPLMLTAVSLVGFALARRRK